MDSLYLGIILKLNMVGMKYFYTEQVYMCQLKNRLKSQLKVFKKYLKRIYNDEYVCVDELSNASPDDQILQNVSRKPYTRKASHRNEIFCA